MSKFTASWRRVLPGIAACALRHVASTTSLNEKAVDVEPETAAGTDVAYQLQVGDGLVGAATSFPDFDEPTIIGPDGHVSLRLITDFPIAGMTLAKQRKS